MPSLITSRRRPLAAASAVLAAAFILSGCSTTSTQPAPPPTASQAIDAELLADHELAGLDAAQIIERLDTMPVAERPSDLIASVRPDALVLTDGEQRETRLPMPDDEVYISIAPYLEQTHDCHFHSLTTCLGELADTEVRVTLTGDDGEVLLDEARQTYDNGFIGIWVPRGIEATLTIKHEGQTGSATISTTNEDDPTCITTLQLT